jgi:hypothetical protein
MIRMSRARATKHCGVVFRKLVGVFVPVVVLTLSALQFAARGANGTRTDQAGATMISYRALIEAPKKFDGKFAWVIGGLKISNGTAYLGGAQSGQEPQTGVCIVPIESAVDPTGSVGKATLDRFGGLSVVSLHGRYESAASSNCPNGTVFAALLEVSFE